MRALPRRSSSPGRRWRSIRPTPRLRRWSARAGRRSGLKGGAGWLPTTSPKPAAWPARRWKPSATTPKRLGRLPGRCFEAAIAAAALDRALALNPNAARAWLARGNIHAMRNQPEAAIEAIERARRLSPFDPYAIFYAAIIASAHLAARRFEQAIEWVDRALHEQPRIVPAMRVKVVANA